MIKIILILLGYKECDKCGRVYSIFKMKPILEVYKLTTRKMWFCEEHAPRFDIVLNTYNPTFDYGDTHKFVINNNCHIEKYED